MKMFRLFEKKKEIQMTVYLLQLMNTYLEQCKGNIVLVKEEPELKSELDKLKSLGLGNSENAKLLKAKIEELETRKKSSQFGKEVFEFIKDIKHIFPSSYLISFDQFYKIIEKYNLSVNKIQNYTGIIPQKNINELSIVKSEILRDEYRFDNVLNVYDAKDPNFIEKFYLVKTVKHRDDPIAKDKARLFSDFISERGYLIRYYSPYRIVSVVNLNDVLSMNDDWVDDKDLYWTNRSSDVELTLSSLKQDDLLIAAPKKCFLEKFKISKMPVDPIVFQCCPYGVIVHSVWGEEADDKVLKEYMELNQKILEL